MVAQLDCGVHPAYNGLDSLPFFDDLDPSSVDVLLVTHFHLDHAAALPYLLYKLENFRPRVFMTHPTKAIYKLILQDFVRVSGMGREDSLYDEQDVLRSLDVIEPINFHQETEVKGIRFTALNAGHVLGAAMFMIEIAGIKVLYTGDYSRVDDRHLTGAELPDVSPHVLIVESTYGKTKHLSRTEREERFTGIVSSVVKRGGRVLLPSFALGRAQELLLILEEHWNEHPELQSVPIYFMSGLARKCIGVFQTFPNMMNERIRAQFAERNPFMFRHIRALKSLDEIIDDGPSIAMASPGMLQSGISRDLFDRWCQDKRNAVVLTGYCVEGTLASDLLKHPATVPTASGREVPLHMQVHYISFSAHADYGETMDFVKTLAPPHVVLVHGAESQMRDMKDMLAIDLAGMPIEVLMPKNTSEVQLKFRGETVAKIVGAAARKRPRAGRTMSGLIVKKDFSHNIMSAADLPKYTQLSTSAIEQTALVPFYGTFEMAVHYVMSLFDPVSLTYKPSASPFDQAVDTALVHHAVAVSHDSDKRAVCLRWQASAVNDMIADAVVAVLAGASVSPAAIKLTSHKCGHGHAERGDDSAAGDSEHGAARESLLALYANGLRDRFGPATVDVAAGTLGFNVRGHAAVVQMPARNAPSAMASVSCADATVHAMLSQALAHLRAALHPAAERVVFVADADDDDGDEDGGAPASALAASASAAQ